MIFGIICLIISLYFITGLILNIVELIEKLKKFDNED